MMHWSSQRDFEGEREWCKRFSRRNNECLKKVSKDVQMDEKTNNNEALGLRNDGERVLYEEPSKTRPKMMRSNGWIELDEAIKQNSRLELIYQKMRLRVKCELGGRTQKHPKTVYSNHRVQYI